MKQTFRLQLVLLLVVVGNVDISEVAGQSVRLLKVPPAPDSTANRTAGGALWKRQGSRLTVAQEVDIPRLNRDRSPAPSAADPERRRAEKNERLRELVESLKGRVLEWQQFEADRQQELEARSGVTEARDTLTLPAPESLSQDRTTNDEQHGTDVLPQVPNANTEDRAPENEDSTNAAVPDDIAVETTEPPNLKLPGDFLVKDAVDRVALADNLYAIGEYSLAKKMYKQTNLEELSPDQQFWVQFQNASCLRQMGDYKAAKKQLRILAGQEEAGWLAQSSRWWLDMIDDRAELAQQLVATQSQLDSEGKHVDASGTR